MSSGQNYMGNNLDALLGQSVVRLCETTVSVPRTQEELNKYLQRLRNKGFTEPERYVSELQTVEGNFSMLEHMESMFDAGREHRMQVEVDALRFIQGI